MKFQWDLGLARTIAERPLVPLDSTKPTINLA